MVDWTFPCYQPNTTFPRTNYDRLKASNVIVIAMKVKKQHLLIIWHHYKFMRKVKLSSSLPWNSFRVALKIWNLSNSNHVVKKQERLIKLKQPLRVISLDSTWTWKDLSPIRFFVLLCIHRHTINWKFLGKKKTIIASTMPCQWTAMLWNFNTTFCFFSTTFSSKLMQKVFSCDMQHKIFHSYLTMPTFLRTVSMDTDRTSHNHLKAWNMFQHFSKKYISSSNNLLLRFTRRLQITQYLPPNSTWVKTN